MSLVLISSVLLMSAAAQDAPPEKLVCKREQTVGTRLSQRVCMTRKQWADRDAATEQGKTQINDQQVRDGRDSYQPYEKPK
jgi:hypothetical protein